LLAVSTFDHACKEALTEGADSVQFTSLSVTKNLYAECHGSQKLSTPTTLARARPRETQSKIERANELKKDFTTYFSLVVLGAAMEDALEVGAELCRHNHQLVLSVPDAASN
jgi:hypothetical protein